MALDLRASELGSRPRTTAERHDTCRQDVKVEERGTMMRVSRHTVAP